MFNIPPLRRVIKNKKIPNKKDPIKNLIEKRIGQKTYGHVVGLERVRVNSQAPNRLPNGLPKGPIRLD